MIMFLRELKSGRDSAHTSFSGESESRSRASFLLRLWTGKNLTVLSCFYRYIKTQLPREIRTQASAQTKHDNETHSNSKRSSLHSCLL